MFDKSRNRIAWEKVLLDNTVPVSFKQAIRTMFIPYNISFEIFSVNCDCIENCCKTDSNGKSPSRSVLETVKDVQYKYSCINCSSMPLWYYMAFPDVFLWTISETPQSKNFFKNFELKHKNEDLLDSTGEVAIKFVKEFVDGFISFTGKKLECSI